jgi:DNA-binding IclR family transcriptional regulator
MSTNSRFAVAVHVLSLMAWSDEEPLKSEQVAESVNTHPVVIRRMLVDLAQAGLVVSRVRRCFLIEPKAAEPGLSCGRKYRNGAGRGVAGG